MEFPNRSQVVLTLVPEKLGKVTYYKTFLKE